VFTNTLKGAVCLREEARAVVAGASFCNFDIAVEIQDQSQVCGGVWVWMQVWVWAWALVLAWAWAWVFGVGVGVGVGVQISILLLR